jgi:hypothetical protein
MGNDQEIEINIFHEIEINIFHEIETIIFKVDHEIEIIAN